MLCWLRSTTMATATAKASMGGGGGGEGERVNTVWSVGGRMWFFHDWVTRTSPAADEA